MIKLKNNHRFKIIEGKEEMKAREKLSSILTGYESWWNDVSKEENQKAREKLIEFYKVLKTYKPSKYYELGHLPSAYKTHTSYMRWLIEIKEAMDKQLYLRACNELGSLMHHESIFQKRIYYNIIHLLESTLDIHGNSV